MLQPKKTKFRKQHKMVPKGKATRGHSLSFGSFGIKSLETGWLPSKQIEAARVAVTRYMKREGQIWCRIFPDKPFDSQCYTTIRTNFARNLKSSSPNTAALYFYCRHNISHRLLPHIQSTFLCLLFYTRYRIVENSVSCALITSIHEVIHKTGYQRIVELRIR